jgi:hypothetical protein
MAYIKMFYTADDTQVSEAPTTTDAVTFTLRADQNEVGEYIGLYVLADDGYVCSAVTVTPTGTTAAKWQLAADDEGNPSASPEAYGAPLALGTVGDTTKVYFHVRAKATEDEEPVNDVTVTLEVDGVAAAE